MIILTLTCMQFYYNPSFNSICTPIYHHFVNIIIVDYSILPYLTIHKAVNIISESMNIVIWLMNMIIFCMNYSMKNSNSHFLKSKWNWDQKQWSKCVLRRNIAACAKSRFHISDTRIHIFPWTVTYTYVRMCIHKYLGMYVRIYIPQSQT